MKTFVLFVLAFLCVASPAAYAEVTFSHGPFYCHSASPNIVSGGFEGCTDNTSAQTGEGSMSCSFYLLTAKEHQQHVARLVVVRDEAASDVKGVTTNKFNHAGVTCQFIPFAGITAINCAFEASKGACLYLRQGLPFRANFSVGRVPPKKK